MSTLLYHSHIKLNDMLLLTRGGGPKQNHLCRAVECHLILVKFLFLLKAYSQPYSRHLPQSLLPVWLRGQQQHWALTRNTECQAPPRYHESKALWSKASQATCLSAFEKERAPLPLCEALLLCSGHLRKSIFHALRTKDDNRTEATVLTYEIKLKHKICLWGPSCVECASHEGTGSLLVGSPFQLLRTDAMSSGPQHHLFDIELCPPEGLVPRADSQSCRSSLLLCVQHSVLSLWKWADSACS